MHYSIAGLGRVVSGALALGLILATLSIASPASAVAAPGGLAPKSGSATSNPVLRWRPVRGAAEYTVEVSDSRSFSSTLEDADTTNTRFVPTDQLPAGRIFWRVRAETSRGAVSRWATASFSRVAPAGPFLVGPASGAQLSQPGNPPLLRWNPVNGAESYEVEIDRGEQDWVESTTYTTDSTSLVVPDPQQPGIYWWRVRAVLDGDLLTRPSQARSYEAGALPGVKQATLVDDDTRDSHIEDVVFTWDPVPGAVSYDIRVSTDDSFNTIIDSRAVKGTRYSPTTTYDNTNYWWQVRSRDIFGQAEEWNSIPVRAFQRAWLPKATLLWPQDRTSVGDDFYYQWTPVRKAARYRLDVGTDPNFSTGSTYETCYTTQTTYAAGLELSPKRLSPPDPCMPRPGTTYFWRVQALDDPGKVNGVLSDVRAFVYDPGVVTQVSPAADAVVDVPTLTWQPADNAVKYRVRVVRANGTVAKTADTHSYSWTYTGKSRLPEGDYTWTVQTIDKNGHVSPLPSVGRPFTISGNLPSGSPLMPSSPGGASPRFPTLTWGAYPDATHYRIKIADGGFNFFMDVGLDFAHPAGSDEKDTYLRPGTYEYYVEAWKGTAKLADGSGLPLGTFTISDLGTTTGHRLTLDASGLAANTCNKSLASGGICEDTRATPLLDWTPVPDAGYYLVYLSYDKQLTNLVYGNKADPDTLPRTQNSMWTPTEALEESQAGGAYYWYIRPCKASGACAADPTEATHAFRKKSNAVQLLGPANAAEVANDVTFTWKDYLETNQAQPNPLTNEKVSQSARGYRVEVADNQAFTKPLDSVVVDQKTYTAFSKTYPEGTLYWRVQAIDGSNNGLAWSETRTLVKKSPRPALTSPVSGASVNGTPPLSWRALDFAASYEVEVYKNADTNASSGNRVVRATSKQTAYSHGALLPVAGKAYVWRVRRKDADGRVGAWSLWRSFKVTAPAARLVSPKAGAGVGRSRVLLTWRPAKGAVEYRVELKKNGSIRDTEMTVATAYAPTDTLERGKWLWRVISYDANGKPMRATRWRSFRAR